MFKHKVITAVSLVLIAIGGYFGYQGLTKKDNAVRYVTAAAEKGTLVISLSGSGQVAVSDQVDIKSKVSGDVVYVGAKNGEEVKAGTLLVQIDSRDAQKAVRDAETAFETAKLELEKLLKPLDELTLLQAENSVVSARRNLEKAEDDLEKVSLDAEQTLRSAYEDSYNAVSNAFLSLPDQMKDLKSVLGTEQNTEENINAYKIILGSESLFIEKVVNDYYEANKLFSENFSFFRTVARDAGRDTLYQLINDTLATAKAISQALESSRNMFDAIINSGTGYKKYYIASTVDSLRSAVSGDISSVNSIISSLERVKDTIDDTNQNTPVNLKNAELAVQSAEESLRERELSLAKSKASPDELDIRVKKITIEQKEDALATARENLADYSIRVPFDGIIAEVNVKKGETISSSIVATIITKQKIAEIILNEIDAAQVKVGQKTTITFDAIENLTISGEVAEVDTLGTVSQGVVTYNAKIAFDTQDERAKPGMSLSAQIITDVRQNALLVPNSAVKEQDNTSYVQLAEKTAGGTNAASANVSGVLIPASALRAQIVETGLSNETMTEILSGLNEGDEVITQTVGGARSSQNQSQQNKGFTMPGGGASSGQMKQQMMFFR